MQAPSGPEGLQKEDSPRPRRDMCVCSPANNQCPVVPRTGGNLVGRTVSHSSGLADLIKKLIARPHERLIAFKSVRVKSAIAKCQYLSTSSRGGYEHSSPGWKILIYKSLFPREKAAEIVLRRCIKLGPIEVVGCNRIEFIGVEYAEPKTLMQDSQLLPQTGKYPIG
jgi:hypothetical protein